MTKFNILNFKFAITYIFTDLQTGLSGLLAVAYPPQLDFFFTPWYYVYMSFETYAQKKAYRDKRIKRYTLDLQLEVYERWKGFANMLEIPFRQLLTLAVEEYIEKHDTSR